MINIFLPCAFKSLLGIDCPTCGAQRSLWLLIHGDWIASLKMYPPLIPVLSLTALLFIRIINPGLVSQKFMLQSGAIVLMIVMVNYVARMFV